MSNKNGRTRPTIISKLLQYFIPDGIDRETLDEFIKLKKKADNYQYSLESSRSGSTEASNDLKLLQGKIEELEKFLSEILKQDRYIDLRYYYDNIST